MAGQWKGDPESCHAVKQDGSGVGCPEFFEILKVKCRQAVGVSIKSNVRAKKLRPREDDDMDVTDDAVAAQTAHVSNVGKPLQEDRR